MECRSPHTLSLLRKLYRELRSTLTIGQKHVYDCQQWKYIMSLAKSSNDSQDDQGNTRLLRLGENYLGYLEHTRKYVELMEKYKGKGERTADDMATLLGFRMPNSEAPPLPKKNQDSASGK